MKQNLFEDRFKKIGLMPVNAESLDEINSDAYKAYIKVMYLPAKCKVKVDFKVYSSKYPSLFFVSPNQFLQIESMTKDPGHFIFYNRDFYCIQIHDEEVACDGLLFNNIHNMPMVDVAKEDASFINHIFLQMENEFELQDVSQEEMLRTYLKQLFIKSARLWKQQQLDKTVTEQTSDLDFFRNFTLLVEANYRQKHSVSDYAAMLFMASKTITQKCKRLHLPQPNEVIKNRIILEAKRLLVHTSLTAKEISYELGYEDPAYFSRLFQVQTGQSPSGFRVSYHGRKTA